MTKKHFIALADAIREHNKTNPWRFSHDQLDTLADWLASQNPDFKRERWLGYVAGENGPSGGKLKEQQPND